MFIDAQEMEKLHPDTFEAPLQSRLDEIIIHDTVKICNGQERFWVIITEINDQKLKGLIDNDLIDNSEYSCGDEIEFEKRHIYSIFEEV